MVILTSLDSRKAVPTHHVSNRHAVIMHTYFQEVVGISHYTGEIEHYQL